MNIKAIGLLASVSITLVAGATDYTWSGSEVDSPLLEENYKVGKETATQLPGTGDTLFLAKGSTWRITDRDGSFDRFKDLAKIAGADSSVIRGASTVVVEVVSSTAAMSSAFTASAGSVRYPTVRKLGAGTLSLTGRSLTSSNRYYDQYCALSVEAGTLVLPQDATSGRGSYLGSAKVDGEGTLVLYGNNGYTYVSSALEGSGLVTNYYSGTSRLYVMGGPGVFSGRIQGKIDLYLTGDLRLTGTDNTCTLQALSGYEGADGAGTLGVGILTPQEDGRSPSVALQSDPYLLGKAGSAARLMFCGNSAAQTVNRNFCLFSGTNSPAVVDAGAYGGVTFSGYWALPPEGNEGLMMQRICLTGSNTEHACVLSNKFFNRDRDGQTYTAHITKDGTGIWRFGNNAERNLAGGIAVEDGTLQFDSIAEKGTVCSLGTSTILYEPFTGLFDDAVHPPVPYAFRLGGGDDPAKEGVFEYTGAAGVNVTSRLAVVSGRARLRNASGKSFSFSGVSSIGTNGGVLTLDGEGTGDVLREVSDGNGAGPLGIVKDGDGTWTLDGNLTFTGPVEVKKGALVVNGKREYSWFRYLLKENFSQVSNIVSNAKVQYMNEFALYDEHGVRQNVDFTMGDEDQTGETAGTLQPGQVAYGMPISMVVTNGTNYAGQDPSCLCDQDSGTYWRLNAKERYAAADDTTWISVVFHMTNATPKIVGFDYSMGHASYLFTAPRIFAVQGSADGITWQDVYSTDKEESGEAPYPRQKNCWVYGDNSINKNAQPAASASPCAFQRAAVTSYTVLTNGMTASVDGGAVLKVVGEALTVKKLILDATGGAGTLENVNFAETGVIDIRNSSGSSSLQFKYALQNVSGFSNVGNWTVLKDGVAGKRLTVSASDDGTVSIVRPGFTLVVR